jgi:hypothetical protein
VDIIVDKISSVENSAIVMLLLYLDKDKNRIIDRLLMNTRKIYRGVTPARMQEDAEDFANLRTPVLKLDFDSPPDVVENRNKLRVLQDDREEKRLSDPKSELEVNQVAAYSYSDELTESSKLHLVTQSIKTLGQVIRNLSAHLPGPRKVEVLRETYLLALRSISRIMELFKSARAAIDQMKPSENSEMSFVEAKRAADELFTILGQLYVVTMCSTVSANVGIANMDKAYTETAEQLGKSIAIRFIDLTVQLNHFAGFPEIVIRNLHEDLRGNAFSSQILDFIVISHLMLHKVDEDTFHRVRRALGMNRKELPMPKEPESAPGDKAH